MTDEFGVLRNSWQRRDYDRTREFLIGKSLESLDIEQLTLLEYASYEYQDLMETRQHPSRCERTAIPQACLHTSAQARESLPDEHWKSR